MTMFKDVDVSNRYTFNKVRVTFDINELFGNPEQFIFDLYRTHSEEMPFKIIKPDIANMEVIDDTLDRDDEFIHYFYKIKATNKLTQQETWSDVFKYTNNKDTSYVEAITHELQTYLEYVISNDQIYVAKKVRTGEKCVCYDPVRKKPNPHCPTCFGSGFASGYAVSKPVYTNFFTPTTRVQVNTDMNLREEDGNPISGWILNYPVLSVGDVIIKSTNERYIINSIQLSKMRDYIFRQTYSMTKLEGGHPAYSIAI